MVYRRELLLGLLQSLGGSLSDDDFQCYVYLYTRRQSEPTFQFVPSRRGPHSFELRNDHRMMIREETILDVPDYWSIADTIDHFLHLKKADKERIGDLLFEVGNRTGDELQQLVFSQSPYLALRMEDRERYLKPDQLRDLEKYNLHDPQPRLYTIGYELRHIEEYINELMEHNVRMLVDVRRNAYSMKMGFKKFQLVDEMRFMGIDYEHISRLGVESAKRKGIESEKEWDRLFREYEEETLPERGPELEHIISLMSSYGRVALTCYERNPNECHRQRVVNALQAMQGWKWDVVHI